MSDVNLKAPTKSVTTGPRPIEYSGQMELFETGARRDTTTGKPRYDLISPIALRRWAYLMAAGAEKYGERNWEKGMPKDRFLESAMRHLYKYILGEGEEDHLAAVLFNIAGIMHMEENESFTT